MAAFKGSNYVPRAGLFSFPTPFMCQQLVPGYLIFEGDGDILSLSINRTWIGSV